MSVQNFETSSYSVGGRQFYGKAKNDADFAVTGKTMLVGECFEYN